MAQIVETFATDRRLLLYNEEFVRKLNFGTAWNKIRIGLRLGFQATSTINSSGLVIGVCTGTTNTYKNANTTEFVGGLMGGSLTSTFTFTAGPPAYVNFTNFGGLVRTGNTNTITNASTSSGFVTCAPATVRSLVYVDIEKQFTSMKITCFALSTSVQGQFDQSAGAFLNGLEQDTPSSTVSFTVNQIGITTPGLYDTLDIAWDNGIQPVEFSDIAAVRLW